jgi:hypothetical protein
VKLILDESVPSTEMPFADTVVFQVIAVAVSTVEAAWIVVSTI